MNRKDKQEIINALIKLRTDNMYNAHLYQGIQLAINVVEKVLDTIPTVR